MKYLVPDVMHDILEGSLQYEVKELLKYFVNTKNYFTLDELNNKINEFPYVLTDKATRPATIAPTVLASSDHTVKQKGLYKHIYTYTVIIPKYYTYVAAEMWCLARLLPLMIGEHIPQDDDRWELYKTFLTILDYVFAPNTNEDIIEYLRELIEDHHVKFRELYPDCLITPKHHYMVHIPDWMEK